ncbi:MAG: acetyl/propionyl-CoA carboxylase subunit alpha, partial [Armatimonadetes bacterium]|nr:acetyl/propionyl-CoA carboxylase subunit alpha [Armatimonadota bacterium]
MRRLLVANRGEIAVRILRAAQECGIETVAVYSEADRDAAFVAHADFSRPLTGVASRDTYLSVPQLLAAAHAAGADAVHPGYGFLSEDADFARAVEEAGLLWVGPPPAAMAAMGEKIRAREIMAGAGVPIPPGRCLTPGEDPRSAAGAVGYPLLVKASAGGGGRGMRRVAAPEELRPALESAISEAEKAFGDGTVFLER